MTTPTTPEQARDFAQYIFDDGAPDDEVELIRSLAEQVEALTAERDEWKARCEFSFGQRDKLTAERDAAREAVISNCARVMTVTAERDALKADAERYRWMTAQIVSVNFEALEKAFERHDPKAESVTQEELDDLFDAALKAVL